MVVFSRVFQELVHRNEQLFLRVSVQSFDGEGNVHTSPPTPSDIVIPSATPDTGWQDLEIHESERR